MTGRLASRARTSRTGSDAHDDAGFTLIELVVAITIIAVAFTAFAHATFGGLTALQASRGRSVFIELANAELERLRSIPFDALGVSAVGPLADPDLVSAYPSAEHDGRGAVLLDVPALRVVDPELPTPPSAVEVVTTAPVTGVRTPYTIRRWITWSPAGGALGLTELKRIDLQIEWSENGRFTRQVTLQSLRYPGDMGPASLGPPPTAIATADAATVNLGSTVSFTGSGTPLASITGYAWQFGDGDVATGPSPTHLYTAVGIYSVVMTVTDANGQEASTTLTVSVVSPNAPPIAVLSANPVGGTAPLTVNVSGAGSSDPEGTPLTYAWDWGDSSAAGSGVNATHVYTAAGSFTLTLTVTDANGMSASASTTISPTPLNCQITAASFKNPGTNAISNDIWLFNNNRPRQTQFVFTATSNPACTSMSASLPKASGTVTQALTFSDAGGVRTWTGTAIVASTNANRFNRANNQSGTFTGSGGATFTISFNAHT